MMFNMNLPIKTFLTILILTRFAQITFPESNHPNIIFVLADDLGYGDVQCNNPESNIPTPNFNRLAKEGMLFTDAHSGSAVCTPTRYGVVTGRYAWRTRLKRGVLNGYSPHLINHERITVASMLRQNGYHTAMTGKWHLGMDFTWKNKGSRSQLTKTNIMQKSKLEFKNINPYC